MTFVGLHGFVKVSISASFKSFLLIICIDAPESTTNSRSSGLRVDAGRHLFSEGEKNVVLQGGAPMDMTVEMKCQDSDLEPMRQDEQVYKIAPSECMLR